MIVITGGAGFIGSCIAARLNEVGREDLILVDTLKCTEKWRNLRPLRFLDYLDKAQLLPFLERTPSVTAIIHMGACSATTERDADYLMENNYRYSLNLAKWSVGRQVRFIYASSAATYGDGQQGYDDDENHLRQLKPLNMYGYSKHVFDLKASASGWLDHIAGIKFFNVYGPNEYHKGDMCSVVYKAFNQIKEHGRVKLFKSHRSDFQHGGQLRDFVYVKDVVDIALFLLANREINGIFNAGTGKARSFLDLATAVFTAMGRKTEIEYIDMPETLRAKYQYFTQANMSKLHQVGYHRKPCALEAGIENYVVNYLIPDKHKGE